jgi:hypothetical protein
MIKMSRSSQDFLKKNFPALLEEMDIDSFLLKLDEFITRYGLDDNDNMTYFGHEAQAVYDDVYMLND